MLVLDELDVGSVPVDADDDEEAAALLELDEVDVVEAWDDEVGVLAVVKTVC